MQLNRSFRPSRSLGAAVLVATAVFAACGTDGSESGGAPDTAAETTAPPATQPVTTPVAEATTTTAPPATAPASTAAPTTAPPAISQWVAAEPMPSLAYIPCCASNYVGEPSPAIPEDPATALDPGIYRATRRQPADGIAPDHSTITFSLAPFVPCATPDVICNEPASEGEVGVGGATREVTLPLDDEVRVVIGGFRCVDDVTFETDHQAGTGTLLAELQAQFDADYTTAVAPLADAGASLEEIEAAFTEPHDGFSSPGCQYMGTLVHQGSAGPAVLLQAITTFDEASSEPVTPVSASIAFLHLTALEIDEEGGQTLYFYASFLS